VRKIQENPRKADAAELPDKCQRRLRP